MTETNICFLQKRTVISDIFVSHKYDRNHSWVNTEPPTVMKMKLAIVVLSVLTFVAVTSYAEAKEALDKIKEECMLVTGAKPDEVQAIFDMKFPQTRSGKCVAACMAKKTGFMSTGNKLNLEQIRNMKLDPELLNVIKVCTYVTDEDECEAVKKLMECLKQYWPEA